jgi:hypothetical protein
MFKENLYKVFNTFIILMKTIIETKEKSNFYFVSEKIKETCNKSNFWITILFVKLLKENAEYNFCYDKCFFIKNSEQITRNAEYDNYLIFFDDCAYSGGQLYETIKKITNLENIKNIYCVLPYISIVALKKITDIFFNSFIKIITTEERLVSIENNNILYNILVDNLCIISYNDDNNYFYNYKLFVFSTNNLPIIFEHKNADSASILQYFYNFSLTYPKFSDNIKIYMLNDKYKKKYKDNKNFIGDFYTIEPIIDNINNKIDFDINKEKLLVILSEKYKLLEISIKQNDDYVGKRNNILDKCYNETYVKEKERIIEYKDDYIDSELCFSAFYKIYPFIIPDSFLSKPMTGGYYKKYMKYKIKNKTKY